MYWIVTESTADLPNEYIAAQDHLLVYRMSCLISGETRTPDGSEEESRRIYEALREGTVVRTTQVTALQWQETIEPLLAGGEDVLVVAFSSGLSATCENAFLAAEKLRQAYPQRQVLVIDSLSASMGEGLMVHYALQNRARGMNIEENLKWLQDNVMRFCHWFTVEDLMFLKRGGRCSAASAILGTMIQVKPVLHVDGEGRLIPREKVQGRKRSLRRLADKAAELGEELRDQTVFISHGDCRQDADFVANLLRTQCGVKDIVTGYIGPVIGAHSGPGTVAVFFLGRNRG